MKNIYFILLLITFVFSCSKSEDTEINLSKIVIGDEEFILEDDSSISNENCESIFVNIGYQSSLDAGFRIYFSFSKNGAIRNISLFNYREFNKCYESADFIPTEILSIKNFSYNPELNYLHFEFQGELVEVNPNYNEIDNMMAKKYIKGEFTTHQLIKTNCTSLESKINFDSNIKFLTSHSQSTRITDASNINFYEYKFYSDNGLNINFQSLTDFWDLPNGSQYNFDENSFQNRIEFKKYIGNIRATQRLWIRSIDWKNFQTQGNFIIQNHSVINGKKKVEGLFNLNIFDDNQLLYTINNIKFETLVLQ